MKFFFYGTNDSYHQLVLIHLKNETKRKIKFYINYITIIKMNDIFQILLCIKIHISKILLFSE